MESRSQKNRFVVDAKQLVNFPVIYDRVHPFFQARSAQVPLIMSGKSMATSSSNYFNVAKALAVNSKDQTGWQQLAQQAKAVSDAMRRLITAIK